METKLKALFLILALLPAGAFGTTRHVVPSGGVASGNATSEGTGWTAAWSLNAANAAVAGDTIYTSPTITGNLFYGRTDENNLNSTNFPSNTWTYWAAWPSTPTEPPNFYKVRKWDYESRGSIVVYNWKDSNSVTIDLSPICAVNDSFYVYDVQNYYGGAWTSGKYSSPISLSMLGSSVSTPVQVPSGASSPTHTAKEFGTFVVTTVAGQGSPPEATTRRLLIRR